MFTEHIFSFQALACIQIKNRKTLLHSKHRKKLLACYLYINKRETLKNSDFLNTAVVLQKCQFSCIRMKKKSHLKLNTNVGRGLELYFIMRRIRREEIFKRGQKVIGKKNKKPKVGFQ